MPDELITLAELFTHAGFLSGMIAGTLALVVLYIASRIVGPTVPGWALALALTAVGVLEIMFDLERKLLLGLGVVAIVGLIVERGYLMEEGRWRTIVLLVSWGSLFVAGVGLFWFSGFPDIVWAMAAAPVVMVGAGGALRLYRHGRFASLVGPMFAFTVFGVWATVPETDMIRVVLGTAVVMALATLPLISARLTGAGAFALAGLLVWVTAFGGTARPASIIVGWACLGILPFVPLLGLSEKPINRYAILGTHIVVVLVASRLMGSWESVIATLIGTLLLVASAVAVLLVSTRSRSDRSVA